MIRNWDVLKKEERGDQPLLDAVPKALPALAQAQAVQSRATKAGLAHLEPASLAHAVAVTEAAGFTAAALGDLLFAIVVHARAHDVDAEEALRLAVRRFRSQVDATERAAARE